MSFTETPEQVALRSAVAQLGATYGYDYMVGKARAQENMTELYREAGKLGYLGVNLPEEYDGGGQGMYELAIVEEELGVAGSPLLSAVDQAVQTLGGNGLASESGLGALIAMSRAMRIAPVSREMILNFVAQHSLGLPKSY